MNVEIRQVPLEKKSVVGQLMQLYQYDFSEMEGADVSADGRFEYPYLDHYWAEVGRTPFLIHVDGNIAGFVLVSKNSDLQDGLDARRISEFFIMRKYRRQGLGKRVAFEIFDRFPGKWHVHQLTQNTPAQGFWRAVIGEYTGGNYTETVTDTGSWRGPTQTFDNSRESQV